MLWRCCFEVKDKSLVGFRCGAFRSASVGVYFVAESETYEHPVKIEDSEGLRTALTVRPAGRKQALQNPNCHFSYPTCRHARVEASNRVPRREFLKLRHPTCHILRKNVTRMLHKSWVAVKELLEVTTFRKLYYSLCTHTMAT